MSYKSIDGEEEKMVLCVREKWVVHLVLISVQFCFSGWHIVGSIALSDGADALVFASYREISASFFMYLIVKQQGLDVHIDRCDYGRICLLGFFSFVNVVGTVLALQYISAIRYSVMQPIIPVVATVISVLVGYERLSVIKVLGILCAVGGAILVETWQTGSGGDDDDDGDSNVMLGTILVCLQVTGMASLIVFQKKLLKKYDPSVLTFSYYTVGGAITVFLSAAWYSRFEDGDFLFHGDLFPWIALIYACIFATVYAYNGYSWAGKRVSPAITTIYNTLQPVGTSILSVIFQGAIITLPEVVGGVLVMSGLVVTVYGRQLEAAADRERDSVSDPDANEYLIHQNEKVDEDGLVY